VHQGGDTRNCSSKSCTYEKQGRQIRSCMSNALREVVVLSVAMTRLCHANSICGAAVHFCQRQLHRSHRRRAEAADPEDSRQHREEADSDRPSNRRAADEPARSEPRAPKVYERLDDSSSSSGSGTGGRSGSSGSNGSSTGGRSGSTGSSSRDTPVKPPINDARPSPPSSVRAIPTPIPSRSIPIPSLNQGVRTPIPSAGSPVISSTSPPPARR
jgi:hypothetical protein